MKNSLREEKIMINSKDLKFGIKVKLRDDLVEERRYGAYSYVYNMKKGEIVTIKDVDSQYFSIIEEDNLPRSYYYTSEMIEYIIKGIMYFGEIPEGSYCYLADGMKTIKFGKKLLSTKSNMTLSTYNENFDNILDPKRNIVLIEDREGNVLWERPEKEDMWKEIDYNTLFAYSDSVIIRVTNKDNEIKKDQINIKEKLTCFKQIEYAFCSPSKYCAACDLSINDASCRFPPITIDALMQSIKIEIKNE